MWPQQVCWQHNTGTSGWCMRGWCCHPEEPGQAGEMGWQNYKDPHLGRNNPSTNICWEPTGWKAALQSMCRGSRWTPGWTASSVPLQQRRLWVSQAAWGGALPAGRGKWSFSSSRHWWGYTWSAGSDSWLPSTREIWRYWWEPNKGLLYDDEGPRAFLIWGKADRAETA